MPYRIRQFSVAGLLATTAFLSACSSNPPQIYQQERFDALSSPYAHTFPAASTRTCEAARRALLSQGYIVSATNPEAVDGSKNFQPSNDTHVVIEFHIVCADASADGTSSIAYVNAVQDRYTLKKTNTSASVGLSVFGSLSLPIGSSDDSMVRVASETIPAGLFYDRYFDLVAHFLKVDPTQRERVRAAAEKEPVAPLPEPAAVRPGEPMKLETPHAGQAGQAAVQAAGAAPAVAPAPASAVQGASAAPAVAAPVSAPGVAQASSSASAAGAASAASPASAAAPAAEAPAQASAASAPGATAQPATASSTPPASAPAN